MDWPNTDDRKDLKHVYQHIRKTIAHLSNKAALAVYSPDLDVLPLRTPAVRETLEGDDPLAIFRETRCKGVMQQLEIHALYQTPGSSRAFLFFRIPLLGVKNCAEIMQGLTLGAGCNL